MTVHVLFFSKADFYLASDALTGLASSGPRCVFVVGYDWRVARGLESPLEAHRSFEHRDIREFVPTEESAESEDAGKPLRALMSYITRRSAERSRSSIADDWPTDFAEAALERFFSREDISEEYASYRQIERAMAHFIDIEKPDCVVLPEDTDCVRGRLAAVHLRRAGVRTVVLMPTWYALRSDFPHLGKRLADSYLVPTDAIREQLESQQVDSSCIHVVGASRFEAKSAPWSAAKRTTTFLYPLQAASWEAAIVLDLVAIFRSHPEAKLILKQHPVVPNRDVDALSFDAPNVEIVRGPLLEGQFSTLAAVIGQSSTMLYEAVATGVPIVVVHYGEFPLETWLPADVEKDVVVRDPRSLERALLSALEGTLEPMAPESFFPRTFPEGRAPRAEAMHHLLKFVERSTGEPSRPAD